MATRFYTASKSRNQGRDSWSVIFRHPTRPDPDTGKPGRRIRRGLGTSDEAEATQLIEQLNEILGTPDLWQPAARATATDRFDKRIVEIFYEGAEAARMDFNPCATSSASSRPLGRLPPRPTARNHRSRQDHRRPSAPRDRPGEGALPFDVHGKNHGRRHRADRRRRTQRIRAVVTFVPRDEMLDYLTENVVEAALAAHANRPESEITRRLLDHVNQRFRFSYVLGRATSLDGDVGGRRG